MVKMTCKPERATKRPTSRTTNHMNTLKKLQTKRKNPKQPLQIRRTSSKAICNQTQVQQLTRHPLEQLWLKRINLVYVILIRYLRV